MKMLSYRALYSWFIFLTIISAFSCDDDNQQHLKTDQACWKWQNLLPTGESLNSVCFISSQTGFIAGSCGLIMKTTDGGENWNVLDQATSYTLNSVKFMNQNTGIAVGSSGTIVKTSDCGDTWNTITSPVGGFLSSVFIGETIFSGIK
jgi:photosystem II stability/assembly factor-like uncharacterized protein